MSVFFVIFVLLKIGSSSVCVCELGDWWFSVTCRYGGPCPPTREQDLKKGDDSFRDNLLLFV